MSNHHGVDNSCCPALRTVFAYPGVFWTSSPPGVPILPYSLLLLDTSCFTGLLASLYEETARRNHYT